MKVSVIVPAFNEESELEASLRNIRHAMTAFTDTGWSSELIVCDNNSTDRTAAIARGAGAEVVFEPINQISRARNAGAARATGDWLVFVDADSYPGVELFSDMAREIQAGRCIAGGSTVRFDTPDRLPALGVSVWNAISLATKWSAGSFMFCETPAFRELGGFSLALFASEEIEFFRRFKRLARRRGRTIVILRRHPMLTSARKMYLYTPREALVFMIRTVLRGGRTLRNPKDCYQWYDGRR